MEGGQALLHGRPQSESSHASRRCACSLCRLRRSSTYFTPPIPLLFVAPMRLCTQVRLFSWIITSNNHCKIIALGLFRSEVAKSSHPQSPMAIQSLLATDYYWERGNLLNPYPPSIFERPRTLEGCLSVNNNEWPMNIYDIDGLYGMRQWAQRTLKADMGENHFKITIGLALTFLTNASCFPVPFLSRLFMF